MLLFLFVRAALNPWTFIKFVVIQMMIAFLIKHVMSKLYNVAPLQKRYMMKEQRWCVLCWYSALWVRYNTSANDQDETHLNFHIHLLLRKCVPCCISPNKSRWQNRRVRGTSHSELYAYQPLTIPLFPFYFVSHLDHLLI